MLPNPFTRLRRVYCQKTALNKRSDSLEGYFPPHLTPNSPPHAIARCGISFCTRCPAPRPGMIASSAGGEIARTPSRQKATHSTPAHAYFFLVRDIPPMGGLGGCRTARKGAVAIGVADLFCGGVITLLLFSKNYTKNQVNTSFLV